jgi:hypothetical protein
MQDPKLTVALADRNGQPLLLISRNDSAVLNRMDWPLAVLSELGYLGACAHIGKLVLAMLQKAHPLTFAPYPALDNPDEQTASDTVRYLLHASVEQRTPAYVSAIDALLGAHHDEIDASTRQHWPDMRARILRDYPE